MKRYKSVFKESSQKDCAFTQKMISKLKGKYSKSEYDDGQILYADDSPSKNKKDMKDDISFLMSLGIPKNKIVKVLDDEFPYVEFLPIDVYELIYDSLLTKVTKTKSIWSKKETKSSYEFVRQLLKDVLEYYSDVFENVDRSLAYDLMSSTTYMKNKGDSSSRMVIASSFL